MVRDGGRVVICGHYTDNGAVEIHPHFQVNRKHVEIRGVWGCDYSHFHRAVTIAARHGDRIPWREMVSRTYPLDQAGAGARRGRASRGAESPDRAQRIAVTVVGQPDSTRFYWLGKISGMPFLELPITTTLVFWLLAISIVASMPFHSSSCWFNPCATMRW